MLFNLLLLFLGGALAESTCNAGSVDRTKVPKSFGADVTESTLRKVWPHIHATHPTVNFWDWYKFFTTYAAYYDHGKAIVGDIYQVWPIDINSYGMTRDIASYNYSLPRALDLSWNEMVFDQLNIPMASLIAANIFYDVEVGFQNHFEGGWNTFSTNYGGTNQTRWEELESSFSFEEYFDHDNVDLLVVVDDSSLISDSDFEEIKSFITNIQTVAGSSSLDISVHAATGGSFKIFQSGALDLSSLAKSDSTDRNFDAIFDAISDDFDSSRSDAAKYVLLIVTGDPTDDVSRIHKKLPGHSQLIIVNIGSQHITLEDDTTKNVYASSAEELNEDDHKVVNLLLEVTQGVIHLWNNGATNVRVHANSKRPFCINTESLGEITTSVAAGDSSVEATILASINNYPSYALFDLKRPVLTGSSSLIKIGPSFKTTYLSIINENDEDILIDFSLNMRTPLFGFYSPDIDLSNCNVHEYCSSDGTCDCISTYKRTRDQECTFSQFIKRPDLDQFVCDIKDDVVEFYINLTDFIPPVTDPRYGEDNRGFCFVDNSTINVLMTKLELAGSSNNTFGNKSCDCSAWKNGKPGELQKYTSADCPDIITKELVEDEAGLLKEVYHFGVGYDDATIETGFGKIMVQPGGRWKLSCDVKRSAAVSMADGEGGAEITYEIENMDEFDVENNQDEVGFDFEFFATADLEGNRRIGEEPLLSNQNVYIQTRISDNNLMKVFTSYCEITVTTNGTVEVFEDILNSGCISAEYEDSFLRPEGFIPSDSGADKFLLRPILPTGFQQASVNVACTVVACPSIGPNEPFCEPGPSCGDIYSAQSLRSLKRFSNRPFQENVGMTLEYKQSTVGEDDGRYSDDEESSALSTCLSVTFALLTIALLG